jgi:hypothetical protein
MPKVIFTLQTAAEVIYALGGPAEAGRLVGRSTQSMSNAANIYHRLPKATYLIMSKRLRRLGYVAPSELWGMATKEKGARKRKKPAPQEPQQKVA